MKYGLEETLLKDLENIFSKYVKIERVVLYGSRAKGNYKRGSDIDLTISGSGIELKELHKICLNLDELNSPYSFDVCLFEKIQNQALVEHINRVGVEIYRKIREV